MNKEICEKNMDRFMLLDKYERIPASVTLHLLTCKKCRTQVHYLSLAEKYAAEARKPTPLKDAIENLAHPVSMTKWIVWGIVMILLMVTFGLILNRMDRTSLSIFFNIFFGTLVTVYCALFVGTNIDFFIKKIERGHAV